MKDANFNLHPKTQSHPKVIIMEEDFFLSVELGLKTLDPRIAYESLAEIKPGQVIEFRVPEGYRTVQVEVTATRFYSLIETMMDGEDMNRMLPGLDKDQVSVYLRKTFVDVLVQKHGLMVIEFRKV